MGRTSRIITGTRRSFRSGGACRQTGSPVRADPQAPTARHRRPRPGRGRSCADRVDQRFLAAIQIVELRFGHAVIHVDRGERQLALLGDLVQAVNPGGGLLADALKIAHGLRQITGVFGNISFERTLEFDLFLVLRLVQAGPGFEFGPPQSEHGRVAAVIEDDVGGGAIRICAPVEDIANIVPVIREAFALDREHRHPGGGDRSGGVILRREDVAGGPADLRTQRSQRFDQHRGLDRHVQRSGDPRALERLRCAEFLAQRHQARHFGFGNADFGAAIFSQREIGDDVIWGTCNYGGHGKAPMNRTRRFAAYKIGSATNDAALSLALSWRQI